MHFPSLYVGNVSKAFDLWPSNSTSKNYYQENNHGYVEKLWIITALFMREREREGGEKPDVKQ